MGGSWRTFTQVLAKELRETLRDNHTLIYSFGFPMIFYPLLVWGLVQILMIQDGRLEQDPPRIAVASDEIQGWLEADGEGTELIVAADLDAQRAALADGEIDLLIAEAREGDGLTALLHHDSTRPRSRIALSHAREVILDQREARLEDLAIARGLDPESLRSWEIESESLSSAEEDQAQALSMILPTFLVLVMLMAAIYPAVEVVVGERERGTLETTLLAAVSRPAIVAGKTAAVAVIVLIAVAGNALALTLTLLHLSTQFSDERAAAPPIAVLDLLMAAPLLLLTALLISALTMVAVLPTRSFKAGQNAATFVMVGGLGLAMIGGLPLTELSFSTACIPLGNLVLVMQATLSGDLTIGPVLMASFETALLTGLAIWLGGQLVQGEAFLFRGALPRWLKWLEPKDEDE